MISSVLVHRSGGSNSRLPLPNSPVSKSFKRLRRAHMRAGVDPRPMVIYDEAEDGED